jgi:hypothetical protein
MPKKVKALGLFSGGLDSQLAASVLREQGIDVALVVFDSPFYNPAPAVQAAEQLQLKLHIVDFTAEIVGLVNHPPHGFGSCMNPCIDCHALMFRRAGEMLSKLDADFLFTGEVLNQRPMSQNRSSLALVARDSTFGDRVLRPLSALLLDPTQPERDGLVDRDRLLGLSGRSRKPQFALAEKYGIKEYPSPAGGCRLTEPGYSARLADLKKHEGLGDKRALVLLRFGRHFRLPGGIKFILGRHADDNAAIGKLLNADDIVLHLKDKPGPTGVLPATATADDINLAASILVRYTRVPEAESVEVSICSEGCENSIVVVAIASAEADRILVSAG